MKTVVITGASSGLGLEFARQVHQVFPEIERVWLIARRVQRLEDLAAQLTDDGLSVLTLPLDLCDTMSFTAYHEHLVEEQPEISLLINNAGCGYLVRCKTCGAESRYLRRGAVVRSIAQGRQDCRCRRCGGRTFTLERMRADGL